MLSLENAEELLLILERYTKLKSKDIPQELDEYLGYVARTGDPVYRWSTVQYFFREKLITVIKDFHDNTPSIEDLPQCPNVDAFNYETLKTTLLERLDLFHAAPFTIQRLCELLKDPRKHYRRLDKFMRALEKNILVVSTIEPGRRQLDSENGESMNGDAMLDVNVDVDMEKESTSSSSSSIVDRLLNRHILISTTNTNDDAPTEASTDCKDESNDGECSKENVETFVEVTPIIKEDVETKLIDIESNETMDEFKVDGNEIDEPHINVVDEDLNKDHKNSITVTNTDNTVTILPEKVETVLTQTDDTNKTDSITAQENDAIKTDDSDKINNIFKFITDPFVDDQTDETSSESIEIAIVVEKEIKEETKDKTDTESVGDVERKTSTVDESTLPDSMPTSPSNDSSKIDANKTDDTDDDCNPKAAKIPRLEENVEKTVTTDSHANDKLLLDTSMKKENENEIKSDDTVATLDILKPVALSETSTTSPAEVLSAEKPEVDTQTESKESIDQEKNLLLSNDCEIKSETSAQSSVLNEEDAVVPVSKNEIKKNSVSEKENTEIPEKSSDNDQLQSNKAVTTDTSTNVELPSETKLHFDEDVHEQQLPTQQQQIEISEESSSSLSSSSSSSASSSSSSSVTSTISTSVLVSSERGLIEKMSVEELDPSVSAQLEPSLSSTSVTSPLPPQSINVIISSASETAMEEVPIVIQPASASSVRDDEQMDVDESNSIDSMDL